MYFLFTFRSGVIFFRPQNTFMKVINNLVALFKQYNAWDNCININHE